MRSPPRHGEGSVLAERDDTWSAVRLAALGARDDRVERPSGSRARARSGSGAQPEARMPEATSEVAAGIRAQAQRSPTPVLDADGLTAAADPARDPRWGQDEKRRPTLSPRVGRPMSNSTPSLSHSGVAGPTPLESG